MLILRALSVLFEESSQMTQRHLPDADWPAKASGSQWLFVAADRRRVSDMVSVLYSAPAPAPNGLVAASDAARNA